MYPTVICRTSSPAPVLLNPPPITTLPLQHDCWRALLHITTMLIKRDCVASGFACDTCDLCFWRIIPRVCGFHIVLVNTCLNPHMRERIY